ncbi:MAG: UDP-D-galactose:(glucosyl)lipopolysaccharide-1,6-D-galactosyltransferase [Elusimicrobia bacterium ADurb.Bin231]|nr:MAG: UDP-D-galactose:(glucosyl)lipopolysaccharide-1,6-D-galactosyltransferase [Elusimicrobia bacterium ADurb.Bin231]
MKILNVIDIPWFSGVTSYALESSAGLAGLGHKIFFAGVRDGLPLKIALEKGFNVFEIASRKNPLIYKSFAVLKKVIDEEEIDIVNAHTGSSHFIAYLASLFTKRKFCLVRTKSDAGLPKKSFLYKHTHKVIAVSESVRKSYMNIGVLPGHVATIYQGIKIPAHSIKIPAANYIGIIGRLDPVKGHNVFLEAASLALKRYPDAKFLIAGKEENIKYSDLRRLAEERHIETSIQFCGFVENARDFMERCSLGIIASLGSEAVSRVLLEWMSLGKPVVSTSVGCIPEILEKDYLVPPNDPAALSKKMTDMIADKNKLAAAGSRNFEIVNDRFRFENFISKTENIFYETIKSNTY